ncbi:MAG: hypothetical protein Q9191_000876 [Dirinaria sp. TL-2023a]
MYVINAQTSNRANLTDSSHKDSIKDRMPAVEAEKLLRIALFSDTLRLTDLPSPRRSSDTSGTDNIRSELPERRQKLAQSLREYRRRSVVPVFFSFMWFTFALVISVQSAFGQIGDNETAHDLAIGLLLSWLPVLVLVTIVDRNPVAPESVRRQLNDLVDAVRSALLNPSLRHSYMTETNRGPRDFTWTKELNNDEFFCGSFFTRFAGQGRLRWHYGVAHSILAGIERTFMANEGRNWLRDENKALTYMVDGPKDGQFEGLRHFDFRMLWQIMSSITIVAGTAAGAFILSCKANVRHQRASADLCLDFTPTVGLGCRSGGYTIYIILTLGSFAIELIVWWSTSQDSVRSWVRRHSVEGPLMLAMMRTLSRTDQGKRATGAGSSILTRFAWLSEASAHVKIEYFLLRPMDFVNSTWGAGTAVSTFVMVVAFVFIVVEWCTQSHLSTNHYQSAMQGLRRTRRFKKYTAWFRGIPDLTILAGRWAWIVVTGRGRRYDVKGRKGWERRSLVWTWQTQDVIDGEFSMEPLRTVEIYNHGHRSLTTEELLEEKPNFAENEISLAAGT